MLTALVLICSMTATPTPEDCNRDTASTVMRVPTEFGDPATCFLQAQGYLAESAIGRQLGPDDLVKVICIRSETVASVPLHRR
jgi:hypothetical protein